MKAGDRIASRYEIEDEAGSGGMGVVYRARDLETGTAVALKVLGAGADAARFEGEARVLALLDHPGIVKYAGHGVCPGGPPYLAMEWLEGEDLAKRLARGRPTWREGVRLVGRVAEALGAAHARGVVHRDLKPSNVLLQGGDLERPTVIDFGVARAKGAAVRWTTAAGVPIGSPAYMAPEQARGEPGVDARADVFSLGCVLFECLAGRSAFEGEHALAVLAKVLLEEAPRVSELAGELPAALDALVARMLSKDRSDRPADGREVAAELATIDGDETAPRSSRAAEPSPRLGDDEQRLVSIVLLGHAPEAEPPTVFEERAAAAHAAIEDIARAHGARLDVLVSGEMIVRMPDGGAATDQAARAAACALSLRAALREVPIALATCRSERGARLPVGTAIDRATRLLRSAEAGHGSPILIDAFTSGLLDAGFDQARGTDGALLLGRSEVDATRTLLGRPTPCVGRDVELSMLEALFAECVTESAARSVLVTAPPGVGKSRLRYELLQRLRARGEVEIWLARGNPVGAGSAFGLAAQALRRCAGVLEGEPRVASRDKLRARVARHVAPADQARVAAFLGEMVGVPAEGAPDASLDPARRDSIVLGDQIRRAWEDFVGAESAAHPVLLVLEDLQWGDRPTIRLVDAALRLHADRPLMALAFARPEIDALFPDLWSERCVQTIRLPGLSRRAGERLVRSVLDDARSDEQIARIVDRAAGNAFYLEELIRAAADGDSDSAPETVVAMVQSRLEALDPEARRVLRAASVFGQVFWEDGVAALLDTGARPTETRARLSDLAERELVSPRREAKFAGQAEYAFRHALVREGAYASLTDADRALGHGLAAAWLEAAGEADAIAIAEHFERGGLPQRAAVAYQRAAEQALEGNDLDAAIERAERGVSRGATGDALGALRAIQAEAHQWRGDHAEAEQRATDAMGHLQPGSDPWAEAASNAALMSLRLGLLDRLNALGVELRAAVADTRAGPGCLRSAARVAAGLVQAGRIDAGAELLAAVESAASRMPDWPAVRARIQLARAVYALHTGNTAAQLASHVAASAAFEEAGDSRSACNSRVHMGFALLELGAFEEAERTLDGAAAVADRMGLRSVAAVARHNLGWALARRGRLDDARRIQRDVADEFRQQHDWLMEGCSFLYLAAIEADLGDMAAAERDAREALQQLEPSPSRRAHALAVLATVLLRAHRATEALDAARDAKRLLDELGGVDEGEALIRLSLIEALAASDDPVAARTEAAAARDRLRARAAQIAEPRWRRSFLAIPEHARTLALARVWLDSEG